MIDANLVWVALAIFGLRITSSALGTLQVLAIAHGRRLWAAALSFFIALIFAVALAEVIASLSHWLTMLAYCGGFAIGSYVGARIEDRFFTEYVNAVVVTQERGHQLAVTLREAGCGVTETHADGRDGPVTVLHSMVRRADVPQLMGLIEGHDPAAFVTVDALEAVSHGWFNRLHRPFGSE
jgi:uncharacterized protein YebE (UPF0316 family)